MIANRRGFYKSGLSPLYLPKYEILCENLEERWQPFYGYRTMKESEAIYAQGRTAPGPVVSNARAGFSAHNYGCATDWTVFDDEGKPTWLSHNDALWQEYQNACKKAGLEWGAMFHNLPDWPHNELKLDCSWGDVGRILEQYGQAEAQKFLEAHVSTS